MGVNVQFCSHHVQPFFWHNGQLLFFFSFQCPLQRLLWLSSWRWLLEQLEPCLFQYWCGSSEPTATRDFQMSLFQSDQLLLWFCPVFILALSRLENYSLYPSDVMHLCSCPLPVRWYVYWSDRFVFAYSSQSDAKFGIVSAFLLLPTRHCACGSGSLSLV